MNLPRTSVLFLWAAVMGFAQPQPPTPVTLAPSTPAPTPVKVATIFGQNAIASTREGQKASAALNAKFQPRSDEFKRKQAELDSLRQQLRKGQSTMSADAAQTLTRTIDGKSRELQRFGEDNQAALDQEEGKMLQDLGAKLQTIIGDYATRYGIAVVIDVSLPNGPVLWASPTVDITNEIVKLYDQAHPVTTAPPTAPPAKK